MADEANIYKPLRRASCQDVEKVATSTTGSIAVNVVKITIDEPAKLAKTPRLKVIDFI